MGGQHSRVEQPLLLDPWDDGHAVLALDLTLAYNVSQDPESFEVPVEPFGRRGRRT